MRDNSELAWEAVTAVERGDAERLGRVMTKAQVREGGGVEKTISKIICKCHDGLVDGLIRVKPESKCSKK